MTKNSISDAPKEMTVQKAFTTSLTDMLLNVGIIAIVVMIIWPR